MDNKPKFVVTLPAKTNPLEFSKEAVKSGADLIEIRNDLVTDNVPISKIASIIDLIASRRTDEYLPEEWITAASFIDQDISQKLQDIDIPGSKKIMSYHSNIRLKQTEIVDLWDSYCQDGESIKYVEPFDNDSQKHLKAVRELLSKISDRVTVLPMGNESSDVRRILATQNYLHYCTLYPDTYSAVGQALLADEIKFFNLN